VMLIVLVRHGDILRHHPVQQILLKEHQGPE
jgi:hypothetical protein